MARSITEGIGQGRVTANLEGAPIDDAYQIPDEEALPMIFDLLEHEGLCMGGSTGINVAGAIRMAQAIWARATPSSPILCDYGNRYQSKLFNPEFLREKGLPVPPWLTENARTIQGPISNMSDIWFPPNGWRTHLADGAGGRCLLVHAGRQARRRRRNSRAGAYSGRGVLRHRRASPITAPTCPTCCPPPDDLRARCRRAGHRR